MYRQKKVLQREEKRTHPVLICTCNLEPLMKLQLDLKFPTTRPALSDHPRSLLSNSQPIAGHSFHSISTFSFPNNSPENSTRSPGRRTDIPPLHPHHHRPSRRSLPCGNTPRAPPPGSNLLERLLSCHCRIGTERYVRSRSRRPD